MNSKLLFTIALAALVSAACSTTKVDLAYAPTESLRTQTGSAIRVESFTDDRGEPANWLVAIRGGFGNPLRNLETSTPVNSLVETAVSQALVARGYDIKPGATKKLLTGSIKKLECNQVGQREANAAIEFRVIDLASKTTVFSRIYSSTNYESAGLGAGVFGSTEDLRKLTEKTLRNAIDKALDDSELLLMIGGRI